MSEDRNAAARPTNVRYVVLLLATMVAVLLYLDRICLGFAERYVKEDLGLTNTQMAVVLQSFFWAYAIGQLPSGWLSDRFGARLTLAIYLAGWSALTGWLGLASTMVWLVVLRFGCGLFEAGAYPACAGVIHKWMPFERRGFASGIISIGGRLGGALAPLVTAYLMVAFVPVSSSSRLEARDLLDGPALLNGLIAPANPSADRLAERVLDHLPSDTANWIRQLKFSDYLMSAMFFIPPESRPILRAGPLEPALTEQLLKALNWALGRGDLTDGLDPKDFDLAPGSLRPLSADRSAPEVERDNRLLLEAAYPDAIRKIYGAGWRPVMMIYGAIGLVVAAIFWWFYRDSPRQQPACNAAEVALIDGTESSNGPRREGALAFRYLLISRSLWSISLVQLLTNFAWIFLITWLPRFLHEVHKVPVIERGWMTSMPIFVGIIGMFAGGWLTDAMVRKLGRRWGRSLPLALSRFVVACGFVLCMILSEPWPITFALCMVALFTDLGTPSVWAYSLDTGGKHVGAVLGWSNMFGNVGAAVAPSLHNAIVESFVEPRQGWQAMFLTCACVMVLAGILAMGIDATKRIVPEQVQG